MTHVTISQATIGKYEVSFTDREGVTDIFKRLDNLDEAKAYALGLARGLSCPIRHTYSLSS